jgi:predicted FMN-binding regulatory protein PaiB
VADSLPVVPALATFRGPEAYITPSWYPTRQETGQVVPTWNCVVVHAYGPLQTFEVRTLTNLQEASQPQNRSAMVRAKDRKDEGYKLRLYRL